MDTLEGDRTASSQLTIVSSRVFPAPRERLFAMFQDPERLAKWWGPKGFTNTFHEFDFRADGTWRFTMLGPDGNTFEILKRFTEVSPPERIVLEHIQATHGFMMSITFEVVAEQTKLTWEMRFMSAAENEKLRSFITAANEENFDRLAEQLLV